MDEQGNFEDGSSYDDGTEIEMTTASVVGLAKDAMGMLGLVWDGDERGALSGTGGKGYSSPGVEMTGLGLDDSDEGEGEEIQVYR